MVVDSTVISSTMVAVDVRLDAEEVSMIVLVSVTTIAAIECGSEETVEPAGVAVIVLITVVVLVGTWSGLLEP